MIRPRLSILAPCCDEEDNLPALYERARAVASAEVGESWELVLVDDGSRDATRELIARLADADPHVAGVFLSRNHGQQLAVSAGLSVCAGERVLVLDADLQDPPEVLPQMMAAMDGGADVVYGRRSIRDGESRLKRTTSYLFYRLLRRLSEVDMPLDTGDFRLLSRRVVDHFNRMPERQRYVRGMISWLGFRQEAVSFHREPRTGGRTKYGYRQLLRLAVDAITSFSTLPLRLAVYIGVVVGVVGLALMIYVVASWLSGAAVRGWTSAISVALVLGSVQLLVVGLIGEYIGRIYVEVKQRPVFFIDEVRRQAPAATVEREPGAERGPVLEPLDPLHTQAS